MKFSGIISGLATGLLAFNLWAAPADLNLLVKHDITEIGADGVTRNIRFQERVYRRNGLVWVERVLPAEAHRGEDHAQGGHDHKHMDLAASARWITQDKGQGVRIRLVNHHDRVVIDVPAAEYANVGFDGSWENAWHLLDPRQLKDMRVKSGGLYEKAGNGNTVRVLWDSKAEIPRRVESANKSGTSRKIMVAEDIPAPRKTPWEGLGSGYQQKEYSDYLD